jgi:hypothetical protein
MVLQLGFRSSYYKKACGYNDTPTKKRVKANSNPGFMPLALPAA